MENPFELIMERLDRIESAIGNLKTANPIQGSNAPMNVKEVSKYLNLSVSGIYKRTFNNEIPHYKLGKILYFKKEEIDEWIYATKVITKQDIENEAFEYLRKRKDHFR